MVTQTEISYRHIIARCKALFEQKTRDYGTSWRIMRLPSITDQIYIKANRIRSIQEKGMQMVQDDVNSEFIGIINYCIMALIQMEMKDSTELEIPVHKLGLLYDKEVEETLSLLSAKNHDYGEAWRNMRVSSITDIILMRIYRIKQIEDNQGKTLASEGVDANYRDMINYCVFALILSGEGA